MHSVVRTQITDPYNSQGLGANSQKSNHKLKTVQAGHQAVTIW